MFLWILYILLCFVTLVQVIYLPLLWQRNSMFTKKESEEVPLSIVICAKNEAENLRTNLPSILVQKYRSSLHEVIVVNDQSTDESEAILQAFATKYPQLRVLNIPVGEKKVFPGKKHALLKGIAATKYDYVLLTDADCKAKSNMWLQSIAGTFSTKLLYKNSEHPTTRLMRPPQIVLGYGRYKEEKGILNKFIRWETVHTAMQYASYAEHGKAYMGVGRNLAYDKRLLQQLENDQKFQLRFSKSPSGDDDLIVAALANKSNTTAVLQVEAHTESVAPNDWAKWWRQKMRHLSTGKYYPFRIKSMLGIYALSHSLYWFVAILLFICFLFCEANDGANILFLRTIAWSLFAMRLFLYWINAAKWYRALEEKKLLIFYPFGDLGWTLYNVILSPYILWKNKQVWK